MLGLLITIVGLVVGRGRGMVGWGMVDNGMVDWSMDSMMDRGMDRMMDRDMDSMMNRGVDSLVERGMGCVVHWGKGSMLDNRCMDSMVNNWGMGSMVENWSLNGMVRNQAMDSCWSRGQKRTTCKSSKRNCWVSKSQRDKGSQNKKLKTYYCENCILIDEFTFIV